MLTPDDKGFNGLPPSPDVERFEDPMSLVVSKSGRMNSGMGSKGFDVEDAFEAFNGLPLSVS